MIKQKNVLIFGATGNIGGATTRELLKRNWRVRAVTRNPSSEKAQVLAGLGAEVVQADMDDPVSLVAVFSGMSRVLSVQNWWISSPEGEIRQGKLVADAAKTAGVDHLVFVSAGDGSKNSGVPHFESKVEVQDYMRGLGLPFTAVRPAPFMELMTESEFAPALAIWGTQIKIAGWDTKLPWVSVRDIGLSIANIFENPEEWIGKELDLISDVKSMRDCEKLFLKVNGKKPARVPLPTWLFSKVTKKELLTMWQWLTRFSQTSGEEKLWNYVDKSRQVNPDVMNVETWLTKKQAGVLS